MAQVFLYNITDPLKAARIRAALVRWGLPGRAVERAEYAHPIGYLTGRPGFAPGSEEASDFTDEMLLMDGLSREQFSGFLDELRSSGAAVALKAIVTPTNAAWNSSQLHAALKLETDLAEARHTRLLVR